VELVAPRKGHRTHTSISVSGAAVLLAAANPNRKSISFQNQGSGTVYLGPASVTTSGATTGYALAAGLTFTDNASAEEWWGIASAASPVNIIDVV
jgi:hypothetical protein